MNLSKLEIWDVDGTVTGSFDMTSMQFDESIYPHVLKHFYMLENTRVWFVTGRRPWMYDETVKLLSFVKCDYDLFCFDLPLWTPETYVTFKMKYFKRGIVNYKPVSIYDDDEDVLYHAYSEYSKKAEFYKASQNKLLRINKLADIYKNKGNPLF